MLRKIIKQKNLKNSDSRRQSRKKKVALTTQLNSISEQMSVNRVSAILIAQQVKWLTSFTSDIFICQGNIIVIIFNNGCNYSTIFSN